ncbi:MAG TPA: hypothetical protein VHI11_06195 [Jiangellaceae bacterium]|jgi:hypothetical protein|nr:hypothetical protein [Jiangellaceae bacterium]
MPSGTGPAALGGAVVGPDLGQRAAVQSFGAIVGADAGDGRAVGTAPTVGPVVAPAVDGDDSVPDSSVGSSGGAQVARHVHPSSVWAVGRQDVLNS